MPFKAERMGIVGLGEIGGMLAEGLLNQGCIQPDQLRVTDHQTGHVAELQARYPGVHDAGDVCRAAEQADVLIVSVRPPAVPAVLMAARPAAKTDAVLWLTSSHFPDEVLSRLWPGDAVTCLPTIAGRLNRGVILAHVRTEDSPDIRKRQFEFAVERCCRQVEWVADRGFKVLNNITGCAPAFVAYIVQTFSDAVVQAQRLYPDEADSIRSPETVDFMVREAFASALELLNEQQISAAELSDRVGAPGGITRTARSALEAVLPETIADLIRRSVLRHEAVDTDIEQMVFSQTGPVSGRMR